MMYNELINSLYCNNINKIIIYSDNKSEYLSTIIYDIISDIILNKNNNCLFYNHYLNDGNRFNISISNINSYVLLLPYITDLLIKTELLYSSDVIIVIKNKNISIHKHRNLNICFIDNIDIITINRSIKINKIKIYIYNKNNNYEKF